MSSLSTLLKAPGAMLECDDDPEAVYELLCAKGWSDGLPVIPPTPERVERGPDEKPYRRAPQAGVSPRRWA